MHSKEQDVDLGIEWHEAADYQGFESFKCFGFMCMLYRSGDSRSNSSVLFDSIPCLLVYVPLSKFRDL